MNAKIVELLKRRYPAGTRVRLLKMEDPSPVPIDMLGTVEDVDDIGSLIVQWDNGRQLHVLHGIDEVEKIDS
jgi:conserved domain protein